MHGRHCLLGSGDDFGIEFFRDPESILILGWIKKFQNSEDRCKDLKIPTIPKNQVWKIPGIFHPGDILLINTDQRIKKYA